MNHLFIQDGYKGSYFGTINVSGEALDVDQSTTVFYLSHDQTKVKTGAVSDILPYEVQMEVVSDIFNGFKPDQNEYARLCAIAGTMLMAHAANLLASGGHVSDTVITIDGQPYRDALAATNGLLNSPGSRLLIMSKSGFDKNPAIGNMDGIVYHGEPVDQYQLSDFSGLS